MMDNNDRHLENGDLTFELDLCPVATSKSFLISHSAGIDTSVSRCKLTDANIFNVIPPRREAASS